MTALWIVGAALGSYLAGAIPFGVLFAKAKGIDLRQVGSGNVGATNVSRALGRKLGIVCFLLDVAKGFCPVFFLAPLAAGQLETTSELSLAWIHVLCAVLGVSGHIFSVFLGFKGGKGVATGLGVFLGMLPVETGISFAIWVALVLVTRYISLASIMAAMANPAVILFWQIGNVPARFPYLLAATVLGFLIVYRHRANIGRLFTKTEPKVFAPKSPPEEAATESTAEATEGGSA